MPQPADRDAGAERPRRRGTGFRVLLDLLKRQLHIDHVLEAPLGIFSQAAQDDLLQVTWHVRNDVGRRLRVRAQNGAERVRNGRARERAGAGDHLVQHGAEAEDVASCIYLPAGGLLGRHVRGGSGNRAWRAKRQIRCVSQFRFVGSVIPNQLGQAEVEHLHRAVRADHDVGRFQIAMDDAARVSRRQRIGDRYGDPQHLAEAHAVPRNERIEALAAHVLHDDEIVAVRRLDLVDGDDVRVIEGRGGVRFLHKPPPTIVVADAIGRQDLDRDLAVETRIAGAIDLAHPTRANQREDLVRPECRAGLESQSARRHYRVVVGQSAPNLRGDRRPARR